MKPFEIKQMIIGSLELDSDITDIAAKLQKEGVEYNFSEGFEEEVLGKILERKVVPARENEFVKNLSFLVNRVAISGIAAILILLLTIFITEGGSFSLNSLVGLSDAYDEGLLCLLGVI